MAISVKDGRHRRSESSRRAIVAAMLALVREGNAAPSAEEVAARGKVGLRSVFRHFANMESLYREMNEVMLAEIAPLMDRPYVATAWRGRLDEMIVRRAELFERLMPVKRASDIVRHKSAFLEREARRFVAAQRRALSAVLPPAQRRAALDALDLVLSFDSWRRLRMDQKLTVKRAREVVAQLTAQLVD